MRLSEAAAQGIDRVRLPHWANPHCYLKQDVINDGRGPWVHLWDRPTQERIGAETPQSILAFHAGDIDEWEPYTGPLDPADTTGGAGEEG